MLNSGQVLSGPSDNIRSNDHKRALKLRVLRNIRTPDFDAESMQAKGTVYAQNPRSSRKYRILLVTCLVGQQICKNLLTSIRCGDRAISGAYVAV